MLKERKKQSAPLTAAQNPANYAPKSATAPLNVGFPFVQIDQGTWPSCLHRAIMNVQAARQ
jgi:hypothetical protein